jgi:hypothetical protein
MLEMQRTGITLTDAAKILNRTPPDLPQLGGDLVRDDGTPLVYIVADLRAPPVRENDPGSPRQRLAATAWFDRLQDAEVKFSVRGERHRLGAVMDRLANIRIINLPATYAAMRARAQAAGIPLATPLD